MAIRTRRLESIAALRAALVEMLQPSSEFVGMLRDWVRTNKAAGAFADLEAFGIDLEVLI